MTRITTVQRTARYTSGILALIFFVNLLLDSQVIPFLEQGPFFGNVAQFLTLLVASALIALDFILVDYLNDSTDMSTPEEDSSSEAPIEPSVD
ncbi:hypothetical protein [Haloarcula nitratireducens]|uniref:Uncharacterized protein n=1 Tax=Haloarcula nitratireducens TaxID=2487749 RepID=A0AAW4PGB4_9EURY|nr:hypothetical protein [Halomicroarcula nitratireducens]MBX0297471.1 hypothetical protein [Halomicroarcula nitratireducens]